MVMFFPKPPSSALPVLILESGRHGVTASGPAAGRLGHRLPQPNGPDDGVFAEWTWDGKILTASTDRYGMHPLFYYAAGPRLGLSPSIPRLLDARLPVTLDFDALSVFLRLGFFIGEDTPFREIRVLPPGGTLTWDGHRLEVSSPPLPVFARSALSRDEAIDAYIELFAKAMERRLNRAPPSVLPLSGGRDSRHILLEMRRQGCLPRYCITALHQPPRHNEDCAVAREICARFGVEHRPIPQADSFFDTEWRKNELTGFCADEHAWLLGVRDALEADHAECLWDGIAGDVLSAGLFLWKSLISAFATGDSRSAAAALLEIPWTPRGFGFQAAERVLHPRLLRELDAERAATHLQREVRRHLDAPSPVGSFFFWNRTRREIALSPFSILNQGRTVFAPYLDHAVFNLLASLPAEFFEDFQFHTEAIARAYPEARRLRYENNQAPGQNPATDDVRFGRDLAKWCCRHPRSKLLRPAAPLEATKALFSRQQALGTSEYGRLQLYFSQLEHNAPGLVL
jgi:hypothetical protein